MADTTPGSLTSVPPRRALDTRAGIGAPAGIVAAGATRTVRVTGVNGIPASGVQAVAVTFTVTGATGPGHVTAYASGSAAPSSSNVNFAAGQTISNLTVVPVGADGAITVRVEGASAHVIGDVSAWVAAGPVTSPGRIVTVAPTRLLDTRTDLGAPKQRVTGPAVVRLQVAGRAGVPADAAGAVMLNVTAVAPSKAGYVAVNPVDPGTVTTSSVNFAAGRTLANSVTTSLSDTGTIELRVSSGVTVDLLVDVFAYTPAGVPDAGAGAVTVHAPERVLDVRPGRLEAGTALPVQTSAPAGAATMAVLNVTAFDATGAGYLTVSAPGSGTPFVSQLSFARGDWVSAQVLAPVDAFGQVRVTVSAGSPVAIVVDAVGYVSGEPTTTSSPASPTGLTVKASGAALALAWQVPAGSGATGFVIRRLVGNVPPASPFDGVAVASSSTLAGTFTDARVGPGVTYAYAVFLRSSVGDLSEPATGSGAATALAFAPAVTVDPVKGRPADVSCPTPTWCLAVDESGQALTYNGSTWSAPVKVVTVTPDDGPAFTTLSCSSSTFCLATTLRGYAVFRSGTWSLVTTAQRWMEVDCYSATRCALVEDHPAGARLAFWNGTSVGTSTTPPSVRTIGSLSCPTATLCVAVGQSAGGWAYALRSSGSAWTSTSLGSSSFGRLSVSCPTATFCLTTSQWDAKAWRFNGTSWAAAAPVSQSSNDVQTASLSCVSSTFCVAVGDRTVGRWNGSTWTVTALTSAIDHRRYVDCASTTMCVIVDDKGRFNRWTGASWSSMATFDATGGRLTSLSCGSASTCLATDMTGAAVGFNGAAWSGPVVISESASLVSCVSSTWCLTVDSQQGTYRKWTGAWGPGTRFDVPSYYDELDCASSTVCFLWSGGSYRKLSGSTWGATTRLFTEDDPVGVDCPTATWCLAVSMFSGRYSVWNGASWSAPRAGGPLWLTALSCTSPTHCLAAGVVAGQEAVAVFRGASFTRLSGVPASVTTLGCQSSTRCLLTDDAGRVFTWDGFEWVALPQSLGFRAAQVDCGPTRCVFVGWDRSTWTL